MSRKEKATRNISYGYLGQLLTIGLGFFSRTIFIQILGVAYLGVNGLYANILGVLSLAELGIGFAMNYHLYKCTADADIEKTKSIMHLYKKAYRIIAVTIAILGVSVIPFLHIIVKDPIGITGNELITYYCIFLFNTVTSYFVAYKFSLLYAEQKDYILTKINAITNALTVIIQIILLVQFKNFLVYLLTGAIIGLVQKIVVNRYVNKLYPYLLERDIDELSDVDKKKIKEDVLAIIFLQIGGVCLYQTDNIIISSFIGISTVGLLSNYTLLIASLHGFVTILFSSVVSGFGNLVATENYEKRFKTFKIYRFAAFWMYGSVAIIIMFLLTPFIHLWIGQEMTISMSVINLIALNYYITGHAIVVNNLRNASGVFTEIKYLALLTALVNLVVSILLVQHIGLIGVFIGTICATLTATFTTPVIVYRKVLNVNAWHYYKDSLFYLWPMIISVLLLFIIKHSYFMEVNIQNLIILTALVLGVTNLVFYLFCKNREEFQYMVNELTQLISKKVRKSF